MARTRILLDSNAYLRLAKSIHPLLDTEFGEDHRYCLYVIAELEREYQKSPRLRRKFGWVDEAQYVANRSRPLKLSRPDRNQVENTTRFISDFAHGEGIAVSPVDIRALATAYVLQIQIVTDDQSMLELANAFGIQNSNTLSLMWLMLDRGLIDMDRVRQIAAYWQFEKDTPAAFSRDYSRLFGEPPPPV